MAQDGFAARGVGTLWRGFAAARGTAAWLKQFLTVSLSLLVVALAAGGYIFYRWEARSIQSQKYNEIAAIAQMKVDQILNWKHERLSDVHRFVESPSERSAVTAWIRDQTQTTLRDELRSRLVLEKDVGEYADVFVVGPDAGLLLSARAAPGPMNAAVRQSVEMAVATAGPVLGDFYRTGSGAAGIDAAEALRDPSGRVIAVFVLTSAASDFLDPMLQSWPTPSRSAETLLGRRDGGDVLVLNQLRHRPATALSMREPLSNTVLPAAQAVLGTTGLFFGRDYRGIEVLADLRGVPGTPWSMVTKVDTAEILSEVSFRAVAIWLVVTAMSLFVVAAAAYGYRTRQSTERKSATDVIRASETMLKESQRIAALGHYVFDVVAGTWSSSEGLDRVYGIDGGYPRTVEGWAGLVHPEHRADVLSHLTQHVLTQGLPFDLEYRVVRVCDGAIRWVHGVGALDKNLEGLPVRMFGTIQDVTERRQLEETLRVRNEELVRFIYTVSHDLKSPLVTIRTFLGFLEDDCRQNDPERVEKDIGFIRRAADKMADLLDDLLELSRVGRKASDPEEVSLQGWSAKRWTWWLDVSPSARWR
ncbi:MAG: histidine kinase dimerization/phospho-acceptor domain-containing protein [Acidobacteriota bacterium]